MRFKYFLSILAAAVAVGACSSDTFSPSAPDSLISAAGMSPAVAGDSETPSGTDGLLKKGKPADVVDAYIVPGTADDGTQSGSGPLATGFFLKDGLPVTVTASGTVAWFAGTGGAATPDGVMGLYAPGRLDTSKLPLSLLARVGTGPYQFVGSGPTTLSGSGELTFYMNDNFHGDNGGEWAVEVTYRCFPGKGKGDKNHYHCGPPGKR